MVMGKFEEIERKMLHYRWLKEIADDYEKMINLIDREKEYFTIQGFTFTARGDAQTFCVNPHRSIPYQFIRNGLSAELDNLGKEIASLEEELKEWL